MSMQENKHSLSENLESVRLDDWRVCAGFKVGCTAFETSVGRC